MKRLAAAVAYALAAASCAAATVGSHVDRGVDFSRYRTWQWGTADALPAGDPRLDRDPFFHDYFQGAVERQLAAAGLEHGTGAAPDLLVHYHASATRRLEIEHADGDRAPCRDGHPPGDGRVDSSVDCRDRVVAIEAGTLVVDVVDAGSHRLVWRGWAQGRLDDLLGHRPESARAIVEAVERMMRRFPTRVPAPRTGDTGVGR